MTPRYTVGLRGKMGLTEVTHSLTSWTRSRHSLLMGSHRQPPTTRVWVNAWYLHHQELFGLRLGWSKRPSRLSRVTLHNSVSLQLTTNTYHLDNFRLKRAVSFMNSIKTISLPPRVPMEWSSAGTCLIVNSCCNSSCPKRNAVLSPCINSSPTWSLLSLMDSLDSLRSTTRLGRSVVVK